MKQNLKGNGRKERKKTWDLSRRGLTQAERNLGQGMWHRSIWQHPNEAGVKGSQRCLLMQAESFNNRIIKKQNELGEDIFLSAREEKCN